MANERAKKVTEYPAATAVANSDLLLLVTGIGTTPATKKIAVSDFTKVVYANTFVITGNNTPANSTPTITKGTIFYDSDYLYIAVADNTLKRLTLESF